LAVLSISSMPRRVASLSVLSLTLLLGSGVATALEPPSPCAVRLEGYGGVSWLDWDEGSTDANANAGGTGSVGCLFGIFHLQGDVFGDYNDVDKIPFNLFSIHTDNVTNVGGGGHIGIADPDFGALEVNGAYNHLMIEESPQLLGFSTGDDGDLWRIGGEGELYLDALTLGVHAGYLKSEADVVSSDDDGYYARGMIRFYATENLKLEGLGGVGTIDGDTIPQARVLAEWRPHTWPVSFFVRGEGAWDNSVDQYFATGGIRVYIFDQPATLRETDRRYFREACVQFLTGVRTC
jgi:hypothetical protein